MVKNNEDLDLPIPADTSNKEEIEILFEKVHVPLEEKVELHLVSLFSSRSYFLSLSSSHFLSIHFTCSSIFNSFFYTVSNFLFPFIILFFLFCSFSSIYLYLSPFFFYLNSNNSFLGICVLRNIPY